MHGIEEKKITKGVELTTIELTVNFKIDTHSIVSVVSQYIELTDTLQDWYSGHTCSLPCKWLHVKDRMGNNELQIHTSQDHHLIHLHHSSSL